MTEDHGPYHGRAAHADDHGPHHLADVLRGLIEQQHWERLLGTPQANGSAHTPANGRRADG